MSAMARDGFVMLLMLCKPDVTGRQLLFALALFRSRSIQRTTQHAPYVQRLYRPSPSIRQNTRSHQRQPTKRLALNSLPTTGTRTHLYLYCTTAGPNPRTMAATSDHSLALASPLAPTRTLTLPHTVPFVALHSLRICQDHHSTTYKYSSSVRRR